MSRMRFSMSGGWSPTGTRVMPGRSTRVMVRTCGEQILRRICLSETPLLLPVPLLVSHSISSRMASNSVKKHVLNCQSMIHRGAKISKQAWMIQWTMSTHLASRSSSLLQQLQWRSLSTSARKKKTKRDSAHGMNRFGDGICRESNRLLFSRV